MTNCADRHKNKKSEFSHGGVLTSIKLFLDRNRLGELLVRKGLISSRDLRRILKIQQESKAPLGKLCVQEQLISSRQLACILTKQHMLRGIAAFMFFFTTMTISYGKKALADTTHDSAYVIHEIAPSIKAQFTSVSSYPALFNTHEKRSGNLKPFTKWSGMFERFEAGLKNDASDRALMQRWKSELSAFRHMDLKTMAREVNRLVNTKNYIVDNRNWGKSDYWATPVEFLRRGGDCEDFAIAKYIALRALGVPEERLRVAIVHDNHKNIPHAILIVYTDQGAYGLDNQIKTLIKADVEKRYRPIFSINNQAWWLHTSREATVIASAE